MPCNFKETLAEIFAANSLSEYLTDDAADKLERLYDAMSNATLNITAIKEPEAVILRHFADSLTIARHVPRGARVADIGCGGGFPSFPLAIARPDLSVVGFDATEKKINYVNRTSVLLGITNMRGVSIRVEEGAHDSVFRESFDFVCARAVASLPVLCEYCLPYAKVGGIFCAMKSKSGEDELGSAKRAIELLGGGLSEVIETGLNSAYEPEPLYRQIILIKKIKPTPKNYPRNNSQISKKPL